MSIQDLGSLATVATFGVSLWLIWRQGENKRLEKLRELKLPSERFVIWADLGSDNESEFVEEIEIFYHSDDVVNLEKANVWLKVAGGGFKEYLEIGSQLLSPSTKGRLSRVKIDEPSVKVTAVEIEYTFRDVYGVVWKRERGGVLTKVSEGDAGD